MNIDTNQCRQIASSLAVYQRNFYFGTYELDQRHRQIMNEIQKLQNYFSTMAYEAEQVETKLRPSRSYYKKFDQKLTPFSTNAYVATGTFKYFAYHSDHKKEHIRMSTNVGNCIISGKCEAGFFKDPHIRVQAKSEVSLLHSKVSTSLGNKNIHINATGNAKVGVASAKAVAVVSQQEQTFQFHVGASAIEAEAVCAFRVFRTTVTLTGSKSLGTAELDLSYSHKNKEWELGSKLGFIAGVGFKVNVKFD